MISFPKPQNLNGSELLDELAEIGIILDKVEQAPHLTVDGLLWLDISEADKERVANIVASHNGTTVAPELTIEEKLALVGLNINDLKAALGL